MYGIDAFRAIINPPQAAILAVGRIAERPVGVDGQITLRPMMRLVLSIDHRLLDGAQAAPFRVEVRRKLESPPMLP
jgi:pyruvate dehydrogenase E2 component (dihydrolipoamide acetyltransferase)